MIHFVYLGGGPGKAAQLDAVFASLAARRPAVPAPVPHPAAVPAPEVAVAVPAEPAFAPEPPVKVESAVAAKASEAAVTAKSSVAAEAAAAKGRCVAAKVREPVEALTTSHGGRCPPGG